VSARDAIHKVRSVRLVRPDDAAYLAAMADQALAHRRYGAREETTATYRASGRVEEAVRTWLATRVPLLPERILSAEVLYRDARTYQPLFLELDAVEGRDGTPARVYEIKFTTSVSSLRRGFGQVERAVRLLGARFERIEGVVVVLLAGRGALDSADPWLAEISTIAPDDLGSNARLPARPLLTVPLEDVAANLAPGELELLQAALDEGDANAIARVERSARIEAGEDVPVARRAPLPGATLTFDGDEPPEASESPFAVLRGLGGPLAGRDEP